MDLYHLLVYYHTDMDMIVRGLSISVILLVSCRWIYLWRKQRGFEMPRRKDQVREIISDYITNALLEAQVDGLLSAKEINGFYRKAARQFGWPDFQGKNLIEEPRNEDVKDAIRLRLSLKELWTKIHFPDAKSEPEDELMKALKL